jgi:hypothetical protein
MGLTWPVDLELTSISVIPELLHLGQIVIQRERERDGKEGEPTKLYHLGLQI